MCPLHGGRELYIPAGVCNFPDCQISGIRSGLEFALMQGLRYVLYIDCIMIRGPEKSINHF